MITPHTQESLKSLSWDEVRSLHTSLGLAATATSRTRGHYEFRILEAQPQKVEEPIAQATTQTTAQTATQLIAQTTDDQPPGRDDSRGRVEPENWFADLFTPKESETQKLQGELDLLIEQELKAQLAIERTPEGSPEEVTAYSHLRKVEANIAEVEEVIARSYPRIWDKADPGMAIGDYARIPFHPIAVVTVKEEMSDGRTRILVRTGNHSEEWYLPAPLISEPIWSLDQIEEAIAQLKSDIGLSKLLDRPVRATEYDSETIAWKTPFQGEILGREGRRHSFFIENNCIHLVIQSRESAFCASERTRKNYHHAVIRQAIEAGKTFDQSSAIGEPCQFGRIHQSCDGWWWAWGEGQTVGHKFLTRLMALKYLEIKSAGAGDRVPRHKLRVDSVAGV